MIKGEVFIDHDFGSQIDLDSNSSSVIYQTWTLSN